MQINIVLFDENLQPASSQIYEINDYLYRLKNRIISILYQIEEKRKKEDIQKYIKKIYYQMNSIDELSDKTLFLGCLADVYSIIAMIENDEGFERIRSLILETANNVVRVAGDN